MTDLLAENEIQRIPLSDLRLDAENPRLLRIEPAGDELTDAEMVTALLDAFDPEPIGRSIVEFGFFVTEPLVVFPEGDSYVVAEGNRRVVALKLLLDPELREAVEADDIWTELADELAGHDERRQRLTALPCQVVPTRADAAPVIGYRHIVGILKWDAYEKAAFVVRLLREGDGRDFEAVADLTGETPGRIRRYLRDYLALEQAQREGLDPARAQRSFGRFERAMNTRGVRRYIGAASPVDLEPQSESSYEEETPRMASLLSFLYGEAGVHEPLFSDTRRIDELAAALDSEDGRRILEEDRDLDRAFDAAGGRKDLVLKNLAKALSALQRAGPDLPDFATDPDVQNGLTEIRVALDQIDAGAAIARDGDVGEGEEYDLAELDEGEDEADPAEDAPA